MNTSAAKTPAELHQEETVQRLQEAAALQEELDALREFPVPGLSGQPVQHRRFGAGTAKLDGHTLRVTFSDCEKALLFPDCLEQGHLRFTDESLQTEAVAYIARLRKIQRTEHALALLRSKI